MLFKNMKDVCSVLEVKQAYINPYNLYMHFLNMFLLTNQILEQIYL